MQGVRKQDLREKIYVTWGRSFALRNKWERVLEEQRESRDPALTRGESAGRRRNGEAIAD